MVAGMLSGSVVSAKEGCIASPSSEDSSVFPEKDYVVSPWIENSLDTGDSIFGILSTQYITQGQTITHNVNVGSGIDYLEVDLNWGDTSDSLALSIYTPSGSKIGTYHDDSDGSVNGRIHINIDPSQGYVEQGIWKFKVYGESVSGTEEYTFNVYQH